MEPSVHPRRARRLRMLIVLLVLSLLAGALTLWYLRIAQWREVTDNAYLTGNLVTVAAEVDGTVVRIGREDNESVEAAEELAFIEDTDLRVALDTRRQMLVLAAQEVLARRKMAERAGAELRLKEITHRLALEEYERRQRLHARRMLAEEELDAARTRSEETAGELQTARHALAEARVRAGSGEVAEHPMVTAAAASLRSAWISLQKTRVPSPVKGVVARRRVQLGQRVMPGTPLFSIAEAGSTWVEANFKESQLRHMRPGQPVRIRSDLYGDEMLLAGRVESIGSGTGAVFAVLPAQNATGNWIKIVQRVAVRIRLDADPDPQRPLPFGASLRVEVDTHDRRGSRLAPPRSPGELARSAAYTGRDAGADALVAETIAAAVAATP